jgi:hypothetical protein
MNEYINDYNQDPTSLNSADDDSGVWFDVIRSNETGQFRDTKYEVKKLQSKVKEASGKLSFVDDRSPLPDSVVENYDNLGYDLSGIYQSKTYDELKQVLEANLPGIIELVPDADLQDSSPTPPLAQSKPANKPTGASRVAIKLDDKDDDDQDTKNGSAHSGAHAATGSRTGNGKTGHAALPAGSTDDFMAEADAILNS